MRTSLTLLTLALAASCGATESAPRTATRTVRVRFGARLPLSTGLSAEETWRPARFVEVVSRRSDGGVRGRGHTDADGRVTLPVVAGGSIAIVTRFRDEGIEAWVARDAEGTRPHEHVVPLGADDDAELAVDVPDAEPVAGALHLLDTLGHGLQAFRAWSGVTLPPIFAHWGRGVTTDWSYFLGQVPEGSGTYGLVLMGGEPGQQASTDTDEHDEQIVLHELGHFVMDQRSGDSSVGGRHPPGSITEPGVAWEEGRASFFAVAALVDTGLLEEPRYRDTIGITPTGSCRVDQDVESPAPDNPRGAGVQESVTAILWDLADGDGHLPDRDDDGVALGPAAVLAAMEAQWAEPGSFPGIASFLDFLVRTGRVEREALRTMLERTGEPSSLLTERWPIDLALDDELAGSVDGVSNPAPSGGEPRPGNGLDAVRAYRVRVDAAGTLEARVAIDGEGGPLVLEVRDRRATALADTRTVNGQAVLTHPVEPGVYVVYVRSTPEGSRAGFRVRAARR